MPRVSHQIRDSIKEKKMYPNRDLSPLKVHVSEVPNPLKLKKSTGGLARNLLKGQYFTNKVNFLPNNPKIFVK